MFWNKVFVSLIFIKLIYAYCSIEEDSAENCNIQLKQKYKKSYSDCRLNPHWILDYNSIEKGEHDVKANQYFYLATTKYFNEENVKWSLLEKDIVKLFSPTFQNLVFSDDCLAIDLKLTSVGDLFTRLQNLDKLLNLHPPDANSELVDFDSYVSPFIDTRKVDFSNLYSQKISKYNFLVLNKKLATLQQQFSDTSMSKCNQTLTWSRLLELKTSFESLEDEDKRLIISIFAAICLTLIIVGGLIIVLIIVIVKNQQKCKCKYSRRKGEKREYLPLRRKRHRN